MTDNDGDRTIDEENGAEIAELRGNLLCAISFEVVRGLHGRIVPIEIPGNTIQGSGFHDFESSGRVIEKLRDQVDYAVSVLCAIAFEASRAGWTSEGELHRLDPIGEPDNDQKWAVFDFAGSSERTKADLDRAWNVELELRRELAAHRRREIDQVRDGMGALDGLISKIEDRIAGAKTTPSALAETAARALQALTDDQRAALFRRYCRGCGGTDPHCNCENDE